jgi:hypothetical protein
MPFSYMMQGFYDILVGHFGPSFLDPRDFNYRVTTALT